jgi:hypothetical protein
MHEMAQALAVAVTVAVHDDDAHVVVGQFGALRDGPGPPVQGVHPVDPHILVDFAATADARDHHHLVGGNLVLHEGVGQSVEDPIVAAA